MCQFLASLNESRESYESYFTPKEMFDIWKKQKVSDYSPFPVTRKTYQELDTVTRLKLRNEYLEKQFQEKKSDSKKIRAILEPLSHLPSNWGRWLFHLFVIPFWCIKKHNPWFLKGCGKIHSLFGSTIRDYSMILATRPDPTVRPPSRCFWKGIYMFRTDFTCFPASYYPVFHVIFMVFEFFRTILEPRYIKRLDAKYASVTVWKNLCKWAFYDRI